MNILFDNIKGYINYNNFMYDTSVFDFNGCGNYKRAIYSTHTEDRLFNKDIIDKLFNDSKLFVYENIINDNGKTFDAELIEKSNKVILSENTYNAALKGEITAKVNVYSNKEVPEFDYVIPEGTQLVCNYFKSTKFEKDVRINGRKNGKKATVVCNILYTNCSYDMFSEFGNDYRHVSYDEETNKFTAFGLDSQQLKDKITDIIGNGLKYPIIFEIYNNNLYPIYGRVEWFVALYLKLPIIPVAIVNTQPKFTIDKFYPESKLTLERLNMFLSPYMKIYKKDENPIGYTGISGRNK
jgi:hypothetical protein